MADNRTVIFEALRALDVKTVTVRYAGSGDSGSIDEVLFDGKPPVDKEVEVDEKSSRFNSDENMFVEMTNRVRKSLEEAVTDLCYDNLRRLCPGWEIDDGSDGEFSFDVAAAEIKLVHNNNIVSQETEEHEL